MSMAAKAPKLRELALSYLPDVADVEFEEGDCQVPATCSLGELDAGCQCPAVGAPCGGFPSAFTTVNCGVSNVASNAGVCSCP